LLNPDGALDYLERAIDSYLERALGDSPRARELCRELSARRLNVAITGTGVVVVAIVAGEALQLRRASAADDGADVTLRGTPLALVAAALSDPQQLIAEGRLTLAGDEQLARRFQELARLLRPGLEAGLAKFIGRIPAHLATRGALAVQHWTRAAARSFLDNGADYLAHESRDLVPRAEAEPFLGGVAALRQRLARAETRVAELAARLTGS
jgi:ubiquinone biosynthesis accessory factor UbiJ